MTALIEGVYYLMEMGEPSRAIAYFERARTLAEDAPDAYYFLGAAYYRMGQSMAQALFYLREAEKRGATYDRFRPNLMAEIQRQYPHLQPAPPASGKIFEQPLVQKFSEKTAPVSAPPDASPLTGAAQLIIEGDGFREGTLSLQGPEGGEEEFSLGEPIPLAEGKGYQLRFTERPKRQFLYRLTLVGAVVGIWLLR